MHVIREGRELVNFCSNDYLGLSCHPRVIQAACAAAMEFGIGDRASPLLCGYSELHEALEEDLARLKGTETALVFSTGYSANLGTLSALGGPDAVFLSDKLNHASLIDACRLSGSRIAVYRHRDANHLEELLRQAREQRKWIVTETVFSMDGDLAALRDLVELKYRYGASLFVDEAHATLVLGERGGGLVEKESLQEAVDLQGGTLSKAFGSSGGFVACSKLWRSYLVNRARTYIYSTALPIPAVAAAREALKIYQEDRNLAEQLGSNVERFRKLVYSPEAGPALGAKGVPICPVILGTERRALEAASALCERGFLVLAIRPPTVPEASSRLRISLSRAHTPEELEALAEGLNGILSSS